MRKQLVFAVCMLFVGMAAAAQVSPASVSLNFNTTNNTADVARACGNTVDNRVCVFYNVNGSTNDYYFRLVDASGNLSVAKAISTNVGTSVIMHATWHPHANRWMVVYKKSTGLYVRAVRSNGNYGSPERKIANFSSGKVRIAPARNKRFIVFIERGTNLGAISLKRTGKIFKNEQTVTSYTNVTMHLADADYQNDKNTAVYFMPRSNLTKTSGLYMLQLNHKLQQQGLHKIATISLPVATPLLMGKYDPVNEVHAVIYQNKFLLVDDNGNSVQTLTTLPTTQPAFRLKFDPVTEQFALLTIYHYEISGTNQGAKYYMSFFDNNGNFTVTESIVKSLTGDTVNWGSTALGFQQNGNYLVTWGWDWPSHGGFYGELFN